MERKALLETEDEDTLLQLAQKYRDAARLNDALETLHRLLELAPASSLAHQELGHTYKQRREFSDAVEAYEKATELNPALLQSWTELSATYGHHGRHDLHNRAARHVAMLSKLPDKLLAATFDMHEGKLYAAEQSCREFMRTNPRNVEGMRLLANIGLKLGILDDAEFLLESCLVFDPSFIAARFDYLTVLHKRQKFKQALEQSKILLRIDSTSLAFKSAFAADSLAIGDFEVALRVYEEIIAENRDSHQAFLHRGHALKTVGLTDEAITSYKKAGKLKSDYGEAFWSLANLKTYQFDEAEVDLMLDKESASGTALPDRYHLCFALGKAFEQRRNFMKSFEFYARGNFLKRSELRYRKKRIEQEVELQKEVFTRELLLGKSGHGNPAADPIFIVGLPRAGSTLLEQVLASHSMVDGTAELPNILSMAHRLNGRQKRNALPKYPGILRELSGQVLQKLGQEYLERASLYRKGAPYFTDKMPNNFRHIGMISLILPNAKIIDARRNPMACCFSVFQQLFAEGQEFSYDLEDIGKYYLAYVDLMDHWERVLPGKILRVNYENVVNDFEIEVRRVLEFCGLPFEEKCLKFHETKRAVRTASSEQVRQPLYKESVAHWRNFEPNLEGLRKTLGELGEDRG